LFAPLSGWRLAGEIFAEKPYVFAELSRDWTSLWNLGFFLA